MELGRTGDQLRLEVGNWLAAPTYPIDGVCPAVASVVITVNGITDGVEDIQGRFRGARENAAPDRAGRIASVNAREM